MPHRRVFLWLLVFSHSQKQNFNYTFFHILSLSVPTVKHQTTSLLFRPDDRIHSGSQCSFLAGIWLMPLLLNSYGEICEVNLLFAGNFTHAPALLI